MSYFQRNLARHFSFVTIVLLVLCHLSCTQHNDSHGSANTFTTLEVERILKSDASKDEKLFTENPNFEIIELELERTTESIKEVRINEIGLNNESDFEKESLTLSTSVNKISVPAIEEPFTDAPLTVETVESKSSPPDVDQNGFLKFQLIRNLVNVTDSEQLPMPPQEVTWFPLAHPELDAISQIRDINGGANKTEFPALQDGLDDTEIGLSLTGGDDGNFSKAFVQTTQLFEIKDARTNNDEDVMIKNDKDTKIEILEEVGNEYVARKENEEVQKSLRSNNESQLTLEVNTELDRLEDNGVGMEQDLLILGNHSNGNQICETPYPGLCSHHPYPKYYFNPRTKKCETFNRIKCDANQTQKGFDTLRECYQSCYLEKPFEIGGQQPILSEKQTLTFDGNGSLLFEAADFPSFNGLIHVSFGLRTYSSNADIVSIISRSAIENSSIQIYFRINRGRFGVQMRSKYKKDEYFLDSGGLQEGAWHSYHMWINPAEGEVKLKVDEEIMIFSSDVILPEVPGSSEINLREIKIFIGGILIYEVGKEMERVVRQNPLKGCMQNLSISAENKIQRNYVTYGTVLKLNTTCSNRCSRNSGEPTKSQCVDKFSEDEKILTLSGHDFLSFKMYDWTNQLHTFSDKISLNFKTNNPDSILLHAIATPKETTNETQFLTLTLTASEGLYLEVNLGGETVTIEASMDLADNQWHSVDIIHERNKFGLFVDQLETKYSKILSSDFGSTFFHLDPYLYIGGIPNINKDCNLPPDTGTYVEADCRENLFVRHYYNVTEGSCREFTYTGCEGNKNNFHDPASCLAECHRPGLRSYNNFIGCLRNASYNDQSILKEWNFSHGKTKYFGELPNLPLEKDCKIVEQASVNFPTENSHLKILRRVSTANNFHLEIVYKRQSVLGVLASGYVKFLESNYQWELRVSPSDVYLIIPVDFVNLKQPVDDEIARWQKVSLVSNGQNVSIISDKGESITALEAPIRFEHEIDIGIGVTEEVPGFMGCVLHDVKLDTENINLRSFVRSSMASTDVIEDGCQMANSCQWTSTCRTETACAMVNSQPVCYCERSSNEGPHCQIAKYRKSCLDYRTLGYNISGKFIIDMDGNGPMPPASVYCKFDKDEVVTTLVSHNAKQNYVFRKSGLKSFQLNITYLDFDDKMLRHLSDDSSSCSQDVKLSCLNAPLRLAKDTWFSSPWQPKIGSFGTSTPGSCKCGEIGNCQDPSRHCNCNIYDNQMHEDKATISKKEHLPVTSIFIVQREQELIETSEAKFSLGKLACKSKEIFEQSLFFQSPSSNITVPIWREGDLRFSFRTTSNNGSIFYQSHSYSVPSFRIAVTSDHSIAFVYKYQMEELTADFITKYKINEGQWNLIWIDSFKNQLRIVFNEQKKFLELPEGQDVSFFDGTAVLGFPEVSLWSDKNENRSLYGFDGCVKNLRLNDVDVNISGLLKYSDGSAVSSGCKAACDALPCENGGICQEKWTSYSCACKNPYAHLGDKCETDINENAVTFLSNESEIVHFNSSVHDSKNPMKENFTFNFRTLQNEAVLLVAKDYIQNLLQVYLRDSSQVVLMFNHGNELVECSVSTNNTKLNGGQSVQVVVSRFESSTALTVFTNGKTFTSTVGFGVLLLSEEEYQQYPFEVLSHLIEYQHSLTLPREYFLMFIGGVQSKGITSDLPSLIGCFRGLKIGEKVFAMPGSNDWDFVGVEVGCSSSCDIEPSLCKNGGHCIISFQLDSKHRCNCLGTSYSGQYCTDEISYNFNERDAIVLPNWTFQYKHHFKIDFAFSFNEIVADGNEQLILAVPIEDERSSTSGVITYTWNNSFNVIIEATIGNRRFSGNSYLPNRSNARHHIYTYFKDTELEVSVNKKSMNISVKVEEDLSSKNETNFKTGLLIGGYLAEMEREKTKNFAGCISNIYIATKDIEFWPLQQYSEGEQFLTRGIPKLGYCAAAPAKQNHEPTFYDFSQIPEWKPFDPQMEPLAAEYDVDTFPYGYLENSTTNNTEIPPNIAKAPQIWPWIVVGCLGLFALISIVVCCTRNCKCGSKEDVEAHRIATVSYSDPPPYSLHPQRTEFVPLLEREPSVICNSRVANRPPVNNGTKLPQTKDSPEETLPLNPVSIPVTAHPDETDQSKQLKNESPRLLNSVNKETEDVSIDIEDPIQEIELKHLEEESKKIIALINQENNEVDEICPNKCDFIESTPVGRDQGNIFICDTHMEPFLVGPIHDNNRVINVGQFSSSHSNNNNQFPTDWFELDKRDSKSEGKQQRYDAVDECFRKDLAEGKPTIVLNGITLRELSLDETFPQDELFEYINEDEQLSHSEESEKNSGWSLSNSFKYTPDEADVFKSKISNIQNANTLLERESKDKQFEKDLKNQLAIVIHTYLDNQNSCNESRLTNSPNILIERQNNSDVDENFTSDDEITNELAKEGALISFKYVLDAAREQEMILSNENLLEANDSFIKKEISNSVDEKDPEKSFSLSESRMVDPFPASMEGSDNESDEMDLSNYFDDNDPFDDDDCCGNKIDMNDVEDFKVFNKFINSQKLENNLEIIREETESEIDEFESNARGQLFSLVKNKFNKYACVDLSTQSEHT